MIEAEAVRSRQDADEAKPWRARAGEMRCLQDEAHPQKDEDASSEPDPPDPPPTEEPPTPRRHHDLEEHRRPLGPRQPAAHWLIVLMILGMGTVGLVMTEMRNSPDKFQVYELHKSFGI